MQFKTQLVRPYWIISQKWSLRHKFRTLLQVDGWALMIMSLRNDLTWCKAVSPSTLAVFMSAPFWSSRSTSSLSPEAHAAKNTHPDENFILRDFVLGETGSRFVSDWAQRFNCSALLKRAELERVSMDMLFNSSNQQFNYPYAFALQTKHTVPGDGWSITIKSAGIIKLYK